MSYQGSKFYIAFLREFNFCMACGRDGTYSSIPEDWFAGWTIERAHIVNKPRIKDRRVIVALCPLCHRASHGIRIVTACRPADWPALKLPHLLWLKEKFDPEYFDLKILQKCAVGRLPEAIAPPECYLKEFRMRRPEIVLTHEGSFQ